STLRERVSLMSMRYVLLLAIMALTQPPDLRARHQARQSIKAGREMVKAHPDSGEAHYNLGIVYIENGEPERKFDEAAAEFREALRLRPDFVAAYSKLGAALHELHLRKMIQECPEDEVESYKHAIQLDRNYAEAYVRLARASIPANDFLGSGRDGLAQAEALYKEALAIDPHNMEALAGLAGVYLWERKDSEFLQECKTILESDPDDASTNDLLVQYAHDGSLRNRVEQLYR